MPARVSTGIPVRRAASSSRFDAGMAVEAVTASTPATCAASWPTWTVTPAARSRSSTGSSRRSLPDTSWPISASVSAMALMPGPPTPTTW